MNRISPVLVVALLAGGAPAQDFDQVEIQRIPVAGHVSMLLGQGGNIGVSAGPDGVILVDDQFAPLTEKIRKAVAAIDGREIRFVLNTHWHGDHTGGNESLAKAGAVIVAHENVRKRMSTEQFVKAMDRKVPPSPPAALPVVTFDRSVTFHWNGDEIHVLHVDPAHTDGDAIVHFRKADVLHMGDTFFNRLYPFIDASSGGSIDGMIAAAERGLGIAGEKTKIIPGHGPLASRADLEGFRAMLVAVRDRVKKLADAGKSVDEIVAAKPTKEFDAAFGGGFLDPDKFVRIVHSALAR